MNAQDGRAPVKRVLVVDDSVDTARMMKALLKREGYETMTANDGEEAIRKAVEFSPDVVLLDLTLPSISGQEVALELRKDRALAGSLIVAISGYGDQGVPPGFDHLMIKPIDHDALKSLLASHSNEDQHTGA